VEISTTLESRPQGAWLAIKAGLVLVAILLFTLTVAGIEFRMGITPTDDSATDWTLSGE
jgi:ABC-type transporter Mla subunit MlaD